MNPRVPLLFLGGLVAGLLLARITAHAPGEARLGNSNATPEADRFTLPAWTWRESVSPPVLSTADARAAIAAWIAETGPYPARADALRTLVLRLDPARWPDLLGPLAAVAQGKTESRLLGLAFRLWTERDPAAAARWAAAAPQPEARALTLPAARAWAQRDLRAAASWACTIKDDALALTLANDLLPRLAKQDPRLALQLAEVRGPAFLEQVLPNVLPLVARDDPGAFIRAHGPALWQDGKGLSKLGDVMSAWLEREPTAAISWMTEHSNDGGRSLYSSIMRALADSLRKKSHDPATLASALASVPDLPGRQRLLGSLLAEWSAHRPEEALAWLAQLPDSHLRTTALITATSIISSGQPEKTLPLALALPAGNHRDQTISSLLGDWAENDPETALAWIQTHPEAGAPALESAHAGLVVHLAKDDPASAIAEWRKMTDGDVKLHTLNRVASLWGETDPAAALRWRTEEENKLGRTVVRSSDDLLARWAEKEPLAALNWAEAQALDDLRVQPDFPVATYFQNFRGHSYFSPFGGDIHNKFPRAATADLFAQIRDPALRADVLLPHLTEWLSKDRPAASAWVKANSALLPPAQSAVLLATPP